MDPWIVQLIGIQVAFVAFLIWLFVRHRSEKTRQRTEERIRLLERFETAPELEQFLSSEAGKCFMGATATPPSDPRRVIVGSIAAGVICTCLGVGMLVLSRSQEELGDLVVPATIIGSAGIGILLASLVSVLLVRLWGLDADHGRSGS